MARVYATREDNGKRVLVEILCDAIGCDASIKPNPDIASSGWVKCGVTPRGGEWGYCPGHAHLVTERQRF